ncbi:MAG: protein kinase, partial [Gemmatimonadota bacterium]
KHKRQVAIKVLKPELAAVLGADRFVQEITTTASLQHPHILPLFDSGTADGFLFYVMPYIEGETLRDKLDRETQLGIEEAVRIAREVADALDYAHRRGVIHRDIKPENILLHDGRPMVADFGIALAVSAAAGGRMTETGTSLGTPHYMSPEQATADKEITARSDLYSLASVLYEMLAGEPPHMANSAQQVIMKIITEPVKPVTDLRKSVPPNVAAALAKALEKLPADRFEGAKAFADALANPAFAMAFAAHARTRPTSVRGRLRSPLWWGAAALVTLLAVALWGWLRPIARPVSRFVVGFPGGQALDLTLQGTHIAVSADGAMMAYTGGDSTDRRIWLKRMTDLDATPVPGTEGGFNPFFSPDGRHLGFLSEQDGRSLKVIALAGGPAQTVAGPPLGVSGAAWGSDGYIYFDADQDGLERIRADGSGREAVMRLDTIAREVGIAWPQVLPDGTVAITRLRHADDLASDFQIVAIRIGSGETRALTRAVSAQYLEGYLFFVTADGTLQAARFDERRLALDGPSITVATGVRIAGTYAGVDVVASAAGELFYVAGSAGVASRVEWVTLNGETTPLDSTWRETGEIRGLALSPDGTRLAVELSRAETTGTDIWIKRLPGPLTRFTLDPAAEWRPSWSGDGQEVLYLTERLKPMAVVRRRADGTGSETVVAQTDRDIMEAQLSADGRWLVARTSGAQAGLGDILVMELGKDTALRPLIAGPGMAYNPALSPDGHWIAYVSMSSGRREVYVRPFPDADRGIWQVSTNGGREPQWSPSGKRLFFRASTTLDMMAVDVETTPTFSPGSPRVLFHTDAASGVDYRRYDVARDGRGFLMVGVDGSDASPQLVRITNALEDLRRRKAP